MPALYPVSVAAEDYKVGDNVKWFTSSTDISPYVGRVVAISPKIQKVWVTWPIGETQQMAPEELILVPATMGMSVVPGDNGYDSVDKQMSAKYFGTVPPVKREEIAIKVANDFSSFVSKVNKKSLEKKASEEFTRKASDTISTHVGRMKSAGMQSKEAFAAVFDAFGSSVPVEALQSIVSGVYQA